MVNIFVGPEKEHFRVHKNLICSKALYFNKMFNGGFKEDIEQTATLPEDSPRVFTLLVEWIYSGRLPNFRLLPTKPNKELVDRI